MSDDEGVVHEEETHHEEGGEAEAPVEEEHHEEPPAPVKVEPAKKSTTTTTASVPKAASPAKSSSPSSAPAGVDSSKLDINKARATMMLVRNPGQNRVNSGAEGYAVGGGTVNTKKSLPSVAPGQHPWIALGRDNKSTTTTKKKIILPPEGAWGDGHPGGVKKFF